MKSLLPAALSRFLLPFVSNARQHHRISGNRQNPKRYLGKHLLPSFLWGLLFFILPFNQANGQFAHLVKLVHSCNGECGYIEFALNGNPNNYTYYWQHGPATLILECVEPGEYTLVVIDLYGV